MGRDAEEEEDSGQVFYVQVSSLSLPFMIMLLMVNSFLLTILSFLSSLLSSPVGTTGLFPEVQILTTKIT